MHMSKEPPCVPFPSSRSSRSLQAVFASSCGTEDRSKLVSMLQASSQKDLDCLDLVEPKRERNADLIGFDDGEWVVLLWVPMSMLHSGAIHFYICQRSRERTLLGANQRKLIQGVSTCLPPADQEIPDLRFSVIFMVPTRRCTCPRIFIRGLEYG